MTSFSETLCQLLLERKFRKGPKFLLAVLSSIHHWLKNYCEVAIGSFVVSSSSSPLITKKTSKRKGEIERDKCRMALFSQQHKSRWVSLTDVCSVLIEWVFVIERKILIGLLYSGYVDVYRFWLGVSDWDRSLSWFNGCPQLIWRYLPGLDNCFD